MVCAGGGVFGACVCVCVHVCVCHRQGVCVHVSFCVHVSVCAVASHIVKSSVLLFCVEDGC